MITSRSPTTAPVDSAAGLLTPGELDALVAGAAWYAKYHQRDLAELADDRSAAAVARREHFAELYAALGKLGVQLRRPVGLTS